MDIPHTGSDEVTAIKRWWKEFGTSIVLGLAVGALVVVGWTSYQNHRRQQTKQASDYYQQLMKAVQDHQTATALQFGERLANEFGATPYATYGRLVNARLHVEEGDLEGAKRMLQAVIDQEADGVYQHLARLRLARLLLAQNQPEAVLTMIDQAQFRQSGAYESAYEEARGDAFGRLQRWDEARAAYQRAQQIGVPSVWLRWKLDDLAVAAPPVEAPPPSPKP